MIRFGFPDQMLPLAEPNSCHFLSSITTHHSFRRPPPPQEIPSAAAVLYQLGLTEMLSPNILQCPTLDPYDWMVAYAALTLPHFCVEHLPQGVIPPLLPLLAQSMAALS